MFIHYLKTTFRNLIRERGYSLINILGLAIGLAASIMIMLFLIHETSYDKFHKDANRTYRIAVNGRMSGDFFDVAVTPPPLGPAIKNSFPEVESSVRLWPRSQESLLTYNENNFYEEGLIFADSSFFQIFDFKPVEGSIRSALYEPFSVVLTESVAKKYFGDENPIDKIIRYNDSENFKVTAIIEDIPQNSHFDFKMLVSWSTIEKMNADFNLDSWGSLGYYTYIKLHENVIPEEFENKSRNFIMDNLMAEAGADSTAFENVTLEFLCYLQAVPDIHLRSNLMAEISPNGNIAYLYTFSAIALFILLIACINFMNLATARSIKRAREVGIRKVHGSYKSQLIKQFLGESIFLSIIALIIALFLVNLAVPG